MKFDSNRKIIGLDPAEPAEKWTNNAPKVYEDYGSFRHNLVERESPEIVIESDIEYPTAFHYDSKGTPVYKLTNDDAVTIFPNYIDNASGGFGTSRVIGKNIPVKALRGNNGNFDWSNPSIFKFLIPGVTLSPFLYNTTNDVQYGNNRS